MKISERIKALRTTKGLSQADLAKEIEVSAGNIGDWERERSKPGADALIALSTYFSVTSDWILGIEPKKFISENIILKNVETTVKNQEWEFVNKFKQLDIDNQLEIIEIVNMKYERLKKKGMLSELKNGEEREEAAGYDTA